MHDEAVTSEMKERAAWIGYLRLHEKLLRQQLCNVPWNCQVRATLSNLLELNVKALMEEGHEPGC